VSQHIVGAEKKARPILSEIPKSKSIVFFEKNISKILNFIKSKKCKKMGFLKYLQNVGVFLKKKLQSSLDNKKKGTTLKF